VRGEVICLHGDLSARGGANNRTLLGSHSAMMPPIPLILRPIGAVPIGVEQWRAEVKRGSRTVRLSSTAWIEQSAAIDCGCCARSWGRLALICASDWRPWSGSGQMIVWQRTDDGAEGLVQNGMSSSSLS